MADNINRPAHYTSHPSGIEAVEISRRLGYMLGNAFKYIARAPYKGRQAEDYRKAAWYVRHLAPSDFIREGVNIPSFERLISQWTQAEPNSKRGMAVLLLKKLQVDGITSQHDYEVTKRSLLAALDELASPTFRFRVKNSSVIATRWFRDGDHPAVEPHAGVTLDGAPCCGQCTWRLADVAHGTLTVGVYAFTVCPGDWVTEDAKGKLTRISHDDFLERYELEEPVSGS